ncbi:MAG: hypothetical protein ABH896_03115, partial [Candidatus Jacksonbacteria bacterium]
LNSESIELELYAPAGDIFIIIRDNQTGQIWTKNILRTDEIELPQNELSRQVKVGFGCNNKESPSKINITEFIQHDWEVIIFTDGLMTGQMLKEMPAVGDDKIYNPPPDQNQISVETTNFEADIIALCLDSMENKLSGDQFWQVFYDKFVSSLKNRRENLSISGVDERHSEFDDATMFRITSSKPIQRLANKKLTFL